MASVVTRDGKPVSPVLVDENAAFAWLLKHQPMSTDWAIKYEGYAIVAVAGEHVSKVADCDTCGNRIEFVDGIRDPYWQHVDGLGGHPARPVAGSVEQAQPRA